MNSILADPKASNVDDLKTLVATIKENISELTKFREGGEYFNQLDLLLFKIREATLENKSNELSSLINEHSQVLFTFKENNMNLLNNLNRLQDYPLKLNIVFPVNSADV